jgi:hypothetical protein
MARGYKSGDNTGVPYSDFMPASFCLYVLSKQVGSWHRGHVLQTDDGRACVTDVNPAALRELVGTPLHVSLKREVFQPMEHVGGNVWIGRATGATLEGLGGGHSFDLDDEAEDEEPDLSEAAVIQDAGPLGSRTSATFSGKYIGTFSSEDEAVRALRRVSERENYYPALYYIDDHGGINLRNWGDYE